MAKIIWTSEAKKNLRDLFDYISLDKPSAASRVVSNIFQKVHLYLIRS
ncbi:MAG: type II toxin-antitoxin system RelE/ParE family toxin [Planctomycetaceae bacterium]|jgi:plasmid stabilization system protein ParE|nr:type II toxin-antitoxin system RelE/ParE family toxin [Planctomycetaceae bacterium]